MIERFINWERPCREPEYDQLTEQIAQLKQQLCGQLGQEGRRWLEQLTDAYMRRENIVLRDAFADGFWSAVELMLEYQHRRT